MCDKCGKMMGAILLVFGILFLLQDLNVWNFWGISWYSALFVLAGFGVIGCHCCKECKECKEEKHKKK
jgi:hypothetical protein